jgi:hemerythrin-like domain-containing protein
MMTKTRQHLLEEHVKLEGLLDRLSSAIDGANAETIQEVWTEFERTLGQHFDTEERFLFPLLQRKHHEEVQRLLREHEQLRDVVSELGVRRHLHAIRKQSVEQLLQQLRRHAQAENISAYAWLDELPMQP